MTDPQGRMQHILETIIKIKKTPQLLYVIFLFNGPLEGSFLWFITPYLAIAFLSFLLMLLLLWHLVLPSRPLETSRHFVLILLSLPAAECNCPREQANVHLQWKTLAENRRRELWPEMGIKRQVSSDLQFRAYTCGKIFFNLLLLQFLNCWMIHEDLDVRH